MASLNGAEELIDDLLPELDETWPSFMDNSSNENFWSHEWNKHGALLIMQAVVCPGAVWNCGWAGSRILTAQSHPLFAENPGPSPWPVDDTHSRCAGTCALHELESE